MKFFVPHAADDEQALRVWSATRDFLASQGLHTEERKIHRLSFHHNSKPYVAEVGKVFPDLREEVLVILKAQNPHLYYVCTANRGVVRGEPYLVGNDYQTAAAAFDD